MHVGPAKALIRFASAALKRFTWRGGGDEAVAAIADEIFPAGLDERLADFEIVFGLEELEQRALELAVAKFLGDMHWLFGERVHAGVVHAGRDIERRWDEILHLIGFVAVLLEEHREVDHRIEVALGVARDEVGDDVLLLARALAEFIEFVREFFEVIVGGLAHFEEDIGIDVLGRDLEMPADVVLDELFHVFRRPAGEVHANAAGDEDFFHAFHLAGVFHELHERGVIGSQQLADRGVYARLAAADGFDFGPRTLHLVHVRGGAADVADRAFEVLVRGHGLDFLHHRFVAARLNNAALVCGDRAERAAAEAAAHDRDGVFDHLVRGDFLGVAWVSLTGVGEAENAVHCGLRDWQRRRVADDGLVAVPLDQAASVIGIGFVVDRAGGVAKCVQVC